jgi:surface antigen
VGTFNGVDAYSNSSLNHPSNDERNTDAGIFTGLKWQCVEYVNRYYYLIHGITNLGFQNANTYYGNATARGLMAYPNVGSTAPQVGDILCFGGGSQGLGHVAIIREVGTDYVKVIQQNVMQDLRDADFRHTLTLSGGTYTVSATELGKTYTTQGWLRVAP